MATKNAVAELRQMPTMLAEKLDAVKEALPKDFNKTRFVQNCIALLNDDPDKYTKYSASNILTNLVKASYLGLDFYSHEAYLIPYGDKLSFMTSYTGSMKLAKKYSIRPIKDIYAKLIREGDTFEEVVANGEQTVNFKPLPLNEGKIIGAFAVVVYQDGGVGYEVMSLTELENVRKCSKASNSPAWKNFPGEMYKKTVLRRLCKYIELEFENISQQETYTDDMAIEVDPVKLHEIDVSENANTEEFIDMDGVVVDG